MLPWKQAEIKFVYLCIIIYFISINIKLMLWKKTVFYGFILK